MELSFNELKKRDVVNVSDGKCYGKITDLTLSFPKGVMTGITVFGSKKNCFLRLFDNNKIFIDEKKILRIGSDVILVDLKCGDTCDTGVKVGNKKPPPADIPPCPPFSPCVSSTPYSPCDKQGENFTVSEDYEDY